MFRLGVLGREEDCATAEADVPDSHLHELTHPATQLIDHLKHQLVGVVVHAVEELLELIESQIADHLAEAVVPLHASASSVRALRYASRLGRWNRLHANVKSPDYKSLPASVARAVSGTERFINSKALYLLKE